MTGRDRIVIDDSLILTALRMDDAPALNTLILKNQPRLAEFMPWANGQPGEEDAREFIKEHQDDITLNKPPALLIWVEGNMVGAIGYHEHHLTDRKVSLGYWIDGEMEGKGIITRSCIAMIDHVFYDLNLNRVSIRCAEHNLRSRAVPERLGFTNEGIEIDGQWVHYRYLNMVHYRMLEREWRVLDARQKTRDDK